MDLKENRERNNIGVKEIDRKRGRGNM